ncbi:hypothetical protein [Methanosphaera sp. BMS]|uniref:hypothetical protein n=1 Tax=Methanosphaera sp. BMS TaxID=1789762 RepID=UPI000DC1E199|nr:hypothetical protein [Methanosphaera sp. BMS]AWX31715.1 hypothetical protein AW729_00815 [Methanosphaera sp. BMS]
MNLCLVIKTEAIFSDGDENIIISMDDNSEVYDNVRLVDEINTTIAGKEGYISDIQNNNGKLFRYSEGSKYILISAKNESLIEYIIDCE